MTRQYRYYDLIMAAFVCVLVCSNLIGPAKVTQIDAPLLGTLTFGAGVLFFPISFIFGDILTEVYGYAASRRVIWAGFAGLAFASVMAWMIVALPPAPFGKISMNTKSRLAALGVSPWRVWWHLRWASCQQLHHGQNENHGGWQALMATHPHQHRVW